MTAWQAALAGVVVTATFGLVGTIIAALLSRRTATETLGVETLQLAIETQAGQIERATTRIDQQDTRIHTLEAEVRACHDERDEDRRRYQADIAELRQRIGGST